MIEPNLNPTMPEHDDPHPLEEELLGILEGLVSTEIADKCVEGVSRALVCATCAERELEGEADAGLAIAGTLGKYLGKYDPTQYGAP